MITEEWSPALCCQSLFPENVTLLPTCQTLTFSSHLSYPVPASHSSEPW